MGGDEEIVFKARARAGGRASRRRAEDGVRDATEAEGDGGGVVRAAKVRHSAFSRTSKQARDKIDLTAVGDIAPQPEAEPGSALEHAPVSDATLSPRPITSHDPLLHVHVQPQSETTSLDTDFIPLSIGRDHQRSRGGIGYGSEEDVEEKDERDGEEDDIHVDEVTMMVDDGRLAVGEASQMVEERRQRAEASALVDEVEEEGTDSDGEDWETTQLERILARSAPQQSRETLERKRQLRRIERDIAREIPDVVEVRKQIEERLGVLRDEIDEHKRYRENLEADIEAYKEREKQLGVDLGRLAGKAAAHVNEIHRRDHIV
ncbi:hypothetical protein PYCC9005_005457 [Savitreella phatthalungensis]